MDPENIKGDFEGMCVYVCVCLCVCVGGGGGGGGTEPPSIYANKTKTSVVWGIHPPQPNIA